jgi:hypothetical protein
VATATVVSETGWVARIVRNEEPSRPASRVLRNVRVDRRGARALVSGPRSGGALQGRHPWSRSMLVTHHSKLQYHPGLLPGESDGRGLSMSVVPIQCMSSALPTPAFFRSQHVRIFARATRLALGRRDQPGSQRVARTLIGVLLAFAVSAGVAKAQSPYVSPYGPGFKARVGYAYVECVIRVSALECFNYDGRVPRGAQCAFGGTVPTVKLGMRGRPRLGYTCVDEGFHGWVALAIGKSFRSSPFRCVHLGSVLRCSSGASTFRIDIKGRVHF